MNTEQILWNKAEEDFHKWIKNPAEYEDNESATLRKSLHFYFRENIQDMLNPISSYVFKKLPLEELLKKEQPSITHEEGWEKKSKTKDYIYPDELLIKENFEVWEPAIRLKRGPLYTADSILNGILNNDKQLLYNFYEKEFAKIAWMILKNKGTIEDAKDIFQDALVILIENITWGTINNDYYLSTYIYSISRNLWYERLRKKKLENEFIDLEKYFTKDISVRYVEDTPDDYEKIRLAIDTLGNPCKILLFLFYYRNLSWDKIAAQLSYASAASARNQKYKCLERIKGLM